MNPEKPEQLTKEQVETVVRAYFDQVDQVPIDELEFVIEQLEEELLAKGIPQKNVSWVLKPYRERLFAERGVIYEEDVDAALEELVLEGRLVKTTINDEGEQCYRVRPIQ